MSVSSDAILSLRTRRDLFAPAAAWFSSHWGVPAAAYLASMEESAASDCGVPQWYVVLNDAGGIAAGIGVIENDFHLRKDLAPNLCALYVEPCLRGQGVARQLLNHACAELAKHGVRTAYLITTHTEFYERCGWTFHEMVEEEEGGTVRMYRHVE